VWTWVAICADTKIARAGTWGPGTGVTPSISWGPASRLANRVKLTTDGLSAYLEAVEDNFGTDIDYAMLVKLYSEPPGREDERRYSPAECVGINIRPVHGVPDPDHTSTSYVERQNLTMRMNMRRFTRLTNSFSKKLKNHMHAISLHYLFHNFCRIHTTLKVAPTMAAEVTDTLHDVAWIVELVEAATPTPGPRGSYRP